MQLNPEYALSASTYRGQPRDPNFWAKHPGILPPHVYAVVKLGLRPYPWQIKALDAFGQRFAVSVCAANETGKTTYLIAPAILWFLDTFGRQGGKVVLTSGSWLQVETQLAPSIRRFAHLFPDWQFNATDIKLYGRVDEQCIMFSTDNPGRAEGHHAVEAQSAPLMIVVDEAKSVPDGIFGAVDRCGPQYLLILSSPGQPSGKFFRTHTSEAGMYWTERVKSTDCPHLDPAKRQRDLDLYGPQSPIFLSMHEAEFAAGTDALILRPADLAACYNEPPQYADGSRAAFCDFAAGGDENVLAIRQGNKAWIEAAWRETDTIQAARRFREHFRRLGLSPFQVFADASGLGTVMCDALADEGFRVQRVNNGASPNDAHYSNLGSEVWHQGAREIARRRLIIQNDPTLWRQLSTRKSEIASGGKLRAEPKEDMKSRGISSPDRADALLGAIYFAGHPAGGAISSTDGIFVGTSAFSRPTAAF